MTMNGNQNGKLCPSNSLGRHAVPLDFSTKSDRIVFGTKAMDELWNSPKTSDDFANDSKYGIRHTLVKENLNGFLFHLSDRQRDGVLSAFDETYRNENDYRDTDNPCINASKMYETDPNLYAYDNVSEYELPELIVCYKEINCHVKDICIDEIRYTEDKLMMESCKSASEISFGKDTLKECLPSDLTKIGEANCGATGQVETDVSEEGCFVNRTLPVQDFGTWSCLRSFLHDIPTLPDQIPSGNAISNSPAAIIVETEPNKGVQCISSKESLERSIENVSAQSFNHKDMSDEDLSPNGRVQYASGEDRSIKNANDQALEAQNVHNHEHEQGNSVSFSFISPVQCDVGESTFSAENVTTYSGPIALSRSLSVQSDSSTTSTQSFTFPVLQSEWKSSPVKMAKADRRHFRKHKCWKTGLLCCRF